MDCGREEGKGWWGGGVVGGNGDGEGEASAWVLMLAFIWRLDGSFVERERGRESRIDVRAVQAGGLFVPSYPVPSGPLSTARNSIKSSSRTGYSSATAGDEGSRL